MDAIEPLLAFALNTRFEDLPPEVIERSRLAVLDTLGTMIAGTRAEGVQQLAGMYREWGGQAQATAFPGGARLPLPHAVFLNALAGRAWDLDDVHEQNTCHVNVGLVPALLACAQARGGIDGRELLAALSVSAEVICRLSSAHRISFSETGNSLTYQCSFYAAAMAAARALKLTPEQARHAQGIAHARVAGNLQGYIAGAMTVRVMQGVAAEGGVLAALMAERGVTGSLDVLEGKFGYYPIFHRGRYERSALLEGLGTDQWRMLETSFKPPYPCCKFTHGPIDAAIAAVTELDVEPDAIDSLDVTVTNREVHDLVCEPRKWQPVTLTDAQFSLPYAVAHAAAHRGVDLDTFQPAGLADPAARRLMAKVRAHLDLGSQGEGPGTFPMPGIVSVRDRRGRTAHRRVDYVKGHPRNPMTMEDVAGKFRACAALGRPQWRGANAVIEAVKDLHALRDAGTLVELCLS